MADPFSPAHLDAEMQRQVLKDKLRTIENDRWQQGIELEALQSLEPLTDAQQGEATAIADVIKRLDARIHYHQVALDNVPSASPTPSPSPAPSSPES